MEHAVYILDHFHNHDKTQGKGKEDTQQTEIVEVCGNFVGPFQDIRCHSGKKIMGKGINSLDRYIRVIQNFCKENRK